MKNIFLFIISIAIIGVQPIFAAKQSVAVLPSDGEGVLNASQLKFFTDKAQEIAVKTLPQSDFDVVQQSVVIRRLGGFDNYVRECKESSCIVELGRKAMVDYVAQCSFTKLSGSDFTVTFELYDVSTEGLIDKFVDKAKNTDGLLAIMQKKIPDGFMKIDAEAYYKRGVAYYGKKDYDKAISEFTEVIRLKPNYAEAYYYRGYAYAHNGNYDRAISDLNEAIRLNPDDAVTYYLRGNVYEVKGNYDRAIADYESALRINPAYSEARKALSETRKTLENLNKQPIYRQPTYGQSTYKQSSSESIDVKVRETLLALEQPTYEQPTYKQSTYSQYSSESIDFSESAEIGWQYIWDMHHVRWAYSWFYNTFGFREVEDFSELEWIVGGIYRWGIVKSITIGFGLFGGLGARHFVCEDYEVCDTETDTNMRHELGVELILGSFSLYIAERNFERVGYGIGFIF